MTVTLSSSSIIAQPGQQVALSSLFTLGAGLPQTIGIDIYDDGNYTEANPGGLGYLSGNGAKSVNSIVAPSGQDFGYVLFQYDASKGEYYNPTLGYWNDITYVAPTGNDHAELLSIFSPTSGGSFSLANVKDYADLSIATESAFTNPFPAATAGQATPDEICAIAQTYVGKVWNSGGCALLVQTIATLAGSSPPLSEFATSVTQPTPAQGNGEWMVAYDGHIQANPSIAAVEAMIRPGDIVSLDWQAGGEGHDFTVVSGSGANALVVDNWFDDSAHDGSSSDIIIQPAHSLDTLLQQNGGALPVSIEVYRLDTPIIATEAAPVAALPAGSSLALAGLFSASDPAGKAVTSYQVYDSASGNSFSVSGTSESAHTAASAITVDSLAAISLSVGTGGGSDTLEVRGFNGTYWGDWQSLTVTDAPALTAAQAISTAAAGQMVLDSAQNVVASLDGLAGLAAKGDLASIALTDSGTPNLTVTAAQFSADSAALNDISSVHTVTVQMSGDAGQYNFTGSQFAGASALQFTDQTVIVAATPGGANALTTGNVTELYSAVLDREPDIAGLAFYQNFLKANPTTPLLQFAEFFLSSAEYTSAHNYAQTNAGDTQFIQDSYQNLLHRTASSGEADFYLTNVIQPALANLTPGTQAYSSAEFQAHAQMLVYFSASPEFLGDVQITAQNPASAQHWLLLT